MYYVPILSEEEQVALSSGVERHILVNKNTILIFSKFENFH